MIREIISMMVDLILCWFALTVMLIISPFVIFFKLLDCITEPIEDYLWKNM